MNVIKTQEPLRVKGVYKGAEWAELYVNKGKSFYWLTYKLGTDVKTIYGWDTYVDAEFEMDKLLLTMDIKKGA